MHIVATHPSLAGLSDASLSNWGCSIHESFDRWPSDFLVLAMSTVGTSFTAADGTVGTPYILARGSGLSVSDISLSPGAQSQPVGASASATAFVGVNGTPQSGVNVTFKVTSGPNAGQTASVTTAADGTAHFSYVGSLAGTDTLVASFTDATGLTQTSNTATVTWTGAAAPAPTVLSVSPASGTVGGTTNLSATLTSGGVAVSGGTVTFTLNGTSVGNATTDATGVATLTNVSLAGIAVGSYPTGVGASFAGDAARAASTGTASLTVTAAASTTAVFEPFDNGPTGGVATGATSFGGVTFSPDHVPDAHGGSHSGAFDGKTGTYVVEPATPTLNLSTATLDFWFQPAQTLDGAAGPVTAQGLVGYTDSPNPALGFANWDKDIYIQADGRVAFYAWLPGASVVTSTTRTWCGGTWYHLTASVGPSGGQQLFVNGQREGSSPTAKTSFTSPNYQLVIGSGPFDSAGLHPFGGKIDEVRVETRELPPAPAPAGVPPAATTCTPAPPAPAVTPAVSLSSPAAGLDFGTQPVGSTSPAQSVTVTNSGSSPLHVSAVDIIGLNAGDFALQANTCVGVAIAPGATCTIRLTFTPTVAGSRAGTLRLADDATDSPQQISLTGVGTALPTARVATGDPNPTPVSLNFPDTAIGDPPSRPINNPPTAFGTVQVTNTGATGTQLTITKVVIAAVDPTDTPGDFSLSSDDCSGRALAPDNIPCVVVPTFAPTGAGLRTASLLVFDNAADSPQRVRMVGRGFQRDTIPPTTTGQVVGNLQNGWYNGQVLVLLNAADNTGGTGLNKITYSATGAQPILTTDAPLANVAVPISAEGTTTFTFFSTDNAGNAEAPHTLTIRIDATPPAVTLSTNAATYTVDQSVVITCSATDSLSGLNGAPAIALPGSPPATIPCAGAPVEPAYVFNVGPNTLTVSATDLAGNTTSRSVSFTVQVTQDSLAALTKQFVSNAGTAQNLIQRSNAISVAGARSPQAKAQLLNAYSQALQQAVQRGFLTQAQADTLLRLAGSL